MTYERIADEADIPHKEWKCEVCGYGNSCFDAECQSTKCCVTAPPSFFTVAVYLEDQSYGGPEEGGWWYTCGEIVHNLEEGCKNIAFPQTFQKKDDAIKAARELNEGALARLNKGRPSISSVLSQGRYVARACDYFPEPSYPKERPYYC